MATIPSLHTWASGERISGTKLNDIRDALDFLLDPPRCHIYNSAGVTFVNTVATRMTCPDVGVDTDNMAVTSPGRVKFTTPGRYRITLLLTMPQANYTDFSFNVRLNSGGSSSGGLSIRTFEFGADTRHITLTFDRDFAAADYIEPFISQSSGANRTSSATSLGTGIQATWVST